MNSRLLYLSTRGVNREKPYFVTAQLKCPLNCSGRYHDFNVSHLARDEGIKIPRYAVSEAAIRALGLRDAKDREIFEAATQEKAVVMTKDSDFVLLLDKLGPRPQVILGYLRKYL